LNTFLRLLYLSTMTTTDRYDVEYVIYRNQVFRKPALLFHVPDKYKTYELCLAAFVLDDVASLQYVPREHKTYELCMTAVKCCGTNVYFVPEEHKTVELKAYALQSNRFVDTNICLDNDSSESEIMHRFETYNRMNAFGAYLEWD